MSENITFPCFDCPSRLKDPTFYELRQVFLFPGQARVEIADDGSIGAAYSPKTLHPSDSPAKFSLAPEVFKTEYPKLYQAVASCTGPSKEFIRSAGVIGILGEGKVIDVCTPVHKEVGLITPKNVKKYFAKDLLF